MTSPAEKIKKIRKQRMITQDQLAKQLGVSRQTIFAIESGRSKPSLSLAIKLCSMLDAAVDDIFADFFKELNSFEVENIKDNNARKEVNKMARDLIPWSPLSDLTDLHREIDRFFEDSLAAATPRVHSALGTMNIKDKGDDYEIQVNVPGFNEDEIDVELSDETLTIKGNKEAKDEEKDKKGWVRKEFSHQSFERSVSFSSQIKPNDAKAKLKNGVLEITVPKAEPAKPKVTKVKVGK